MLARFSTSRALSAAGSKVDWPMVATPESAVNRLRALFDIGQSDR
jgi:hypothetical protein